MKMEYVNPKLILIPVADEDAITTSLVSVESGDPTSIDIDAINNR